jgi:hypothetical protein
MTDRPPARRARLAAATLVVAAVACSPSPSPSPAAFDGRLLVHTGRPETNQLQAIDGFGSVAELAPPEGGLSWFAAALDGRLAGVDGGGAVVVADGDASTWRAIPLDEVPIGAETADVRLPAWSPDGRLAVLFGVAGRATTAGVLVTDPTTDGSFWIDLATGLGGYPPTWLDGNRLAVPTRGAQDRPTLAILEVDASRVNEVRDDVRLLAASADRSTLVVVGPDRRTIEVWRPADWESGDQAGLLARYVAAPTSSDVDAVALDATGDRLALGIVAPDRTAASLVRVVEPVAVSEVLVEVELGTGAPIGALGFVP